MTARGLLYQPTIAAAALALATLACYLPGLGGDFLWIDWSEIVDGRMIVPLERLGAIFFEADNTAGYHRPLYQVMHSLDLAVWGPRPFGFHLSSALLHAANVFLVVLLVARGGTRLGRAATLGALWGLHPVNSAVVGLIHAKADLLSTFLLLVAALALQRLLRSSRPRPGAWFLSLGSLALALCTKETAFLFPAALTLYGFLEQDRVGGKRWRLYLIAAWIVTVALGVLHLHATSATPRMGAGLGLGERLLTFAGVYLDYLRILVLPVDLSMADTVTRFAAQPPLARILAVAGCGVAIALQVGIALRWRPLARWIVLFHLSLLPVAQIVPILHFRADRYLYLPSLAFVGACVEGAHLLLAWIREPAASPSRRLPAAALLVLVGAGLYGGRVLVRLADFRDDLTLFGPAIDRVPDYLEGLAVLAAAHDRRGEHARAETFYRRALVPHPGRISYLKRDAVLVNYSNNLLLQGKHEEALVFAREHERDVRREEARDELRYNRAVAAYDLDRFDEVVPLLLEYGSRHPDDAGAHYLLGVAALRLNDERLAASALRRFLALPSRDPARAAAARDLLEQIRRQQGGR